MFANRSRRLGEAAKALSLILLQLLAMEAMQAQDGAAADPQSLPLRAAAGLTIESVAAPELIKWPIVADWDSAGRLVVAECGGVSKPIAEHNKRQLHRIVRLVDSDGDNKFDKRIVAADNMAFPEGVLCVGNSILVSAPPQIWKLTDANDDGVCEQREVWFDPGTLTGCANDLHGPYMGRDGWIYWCKGAFAEQHHALLSGKQLVTSAAHIFRRRFEGGAVEPVMTGGMDNPVEMAMSHTGERFFTSTFLQAPADGKRDGIAHALYGGVYGKPNKAADGHKRTGDLLPIMTHLGPAAPSGLICLESSEIMDRIAQLKSNAISAKSTEQAQLQPIDTLVAAQFNLHKVTAHRLIPRGASFVTADIELVTTQRIDFHPTDVVECNDGSLLVIDTGGWYNLCCPSSGVDQSIAPGGIYRLTTRAIADRLKNSAQTVEAGKSFGRFGNSVIDALSTARAMQLARDTAEPLKNRQLALWRVCRLNDDAAHTALISALQLPEPSLRQIAAHSLSVQRVKRSARALEQALVAETEPQVQRALAEAIGRLGTAESIPALLSALAAVEDDRMLEHSLLYALIELDQPQHLFATLENQSNHKLQRAAMIVLEQTGHSELLKPRNIIEALSSGQAELRKTAVEISARHPQWAADQREALAQAWQRALADTDLRTSLSELFAAWSSTPVVTGLIGEQLTAAKSMTIADQRALAETLSGIRNQALPGVWVDGLLHLLEQADDETQLKLVNWLAGMKIEGDDSTKLRDALVGLVQQDNSASTKLHLLTALPVGAQLTDKTLEKLIIDSFFGEHGADSASSAVKVVERVRLSRTAAEQLIEGLEHIPPLQLLPTISAVSRLQDDELDKRLLERLERTTAARTLPLDQVNSIYRSRSENVRSLARRVVESLGKPPADVEAKLDTLLGQLKSGDVARGFQVFRSTKAACSACHRIGYVGGQVGPELSRIGATRTRRALLEAIVFPNARLEQSYAPLRVLTVDGQVFNGLVARESGGSIELITGANQRVIIQQEDIEQRLPSPVSIMPAGLEQQLTLDELADLLTLLEATK